MSHDKDNYHQPFPTRLRSLMDDRRVSQQQIADYVDVKRQTVAQWKDGNTAPDIYSFQKIAEFFDIPYEYLYGESDSAVYENMLLSEELGLTDGAIKNLRGVKEGEESTGEGAAVSAIVSEMLASPNLLYGARCLHTAIQMKLEAREDVGELDEAQQAARDSLESAGMHVLNQYEASEFYYTRAIEEFERTAQSIVRLYGIMAPGDVDDMIAQRRVMKQAEQKAREDDGNSGQAGR